MGFNDTLVLAKHGAIPLLLIKNNYFRTKIQLTEEIFSNGINHWKLFYKNCRPSSKETGFCCLLIYFSAFKGTSKSINTEACFYILYILYFPLKITGMRMLFHSYNTLYKNLKILIHWQNMKMSDIQYKKSEITFSFQRFSNIGAY